MLRAKPPVSRLVALGLLTLMAPRPARPETTDSTVVPAQVNALEACEPLSGSAATRKVNRERRLALLDSITGDASDWWIVQRGDWTVPQALTLEHTRVVSTVASKDGTANAVVSIDSLNEIGCRPGLYLLNVDDSLGANARVLAILEDIVLVEWEGQLRYLSRPGSTVPMWHMIWQAPWTLLWPRTQGPSATAPSYRRW